MFKRIKGSPGFYISDTGEVKNKNGLIMKPFITKDGYERINLPYKGKRLNRTIHLLVAEAFLQTGKYAGYTNIQINHIDGDKRNNNVLNLEPVTGTENVNHAHNLGLYKYDLKLNLLDTKTEKQMKFRSIRKLAKYLNVSVNYLKPRIVISKMYPIFKRYVITYNEKDYKNLIMVLKSPKSFYALDHVTGNLTKLTSFSQIAILYGLSYITIGKKLRKNPNQNVYIGGITFSYSKNIDKINRHLAILDIDREWRKLIANTLNRT